MIPSRTCRNRDDPAHCLDPATGLQITMNSKIRLINHRGYGHRSLPALIAMIYLCCGGITVQLPFETS